MTEGLRIREDEPPSPEALEMGAEGVEGPEAQVAERSVRRLVLVRREQFLAGASQEPGELARNTPFRRYALATHGAQRPEMSGPPSGAAA